MLKAIIFDVGGVLIRTHSRAGRERWAARFGLDPWDFENFIFNGQSGRAAQLGQKSEAAHWQWLGRHFELSQTELSRMHHDFFAGDVMNEPLVAYIRRLRQAGYKTGILSNYGDHARQLWGEVYPFINYFDAVVISAEVGMMKPEAKIYHLAAAHVGVAINEAIFVDDFAHNIEAARIEGMQAVHYSDPVTAQAELVRLTGVE